MSGLVAKEEIKFRIARRIAREFMGWNRTLVINLGVGTPTLVADYISSPRIFIQAENGMLGVGPKAKGPDADPCIINAGREIVTQTPGSCYFDSATSFGMIRGGHIDATVIGAFEVDEGGSIANWIIPNGRQLGVGGAMDLVTGARQVIVALRHTGGDGSPKLVRSCSLPITGFHEADMVVTELAVFRFKNGRMILTELAPEIDLAGLRAVTAARFEVDPQLAAMPVDSFN
jgi:3-oxoacid CoA-transferase B subunit